MRSARAYAEVAVRKAWADLLLRLGLRERSAEAYDKALVRAFALALDFEPVGVTARPDEPRTLATGRGYNRTIMFPPRWKATP